MTSTQSKGGSHGNMHGSGSGKSAGGGNLSDAAHKMRSGNPEERSEGAHEMGKAGGHQSHKNDNPSGSSGNR